MPNRLPSRIISPTREAGQGMDRGVVTSIAALLALALAGCGTMDLCGNEIVSRLASPTGTHDVIVFERDCGATTEWSTQVSIVRGGSAFLEKPTALRSTQPGNALVILARAKRRGVTGIAVIAKWTDDTHVTLEYEAGAGMSTVATVVDGITITPQSVECSQ